MANGNNAKLVVVGDQSSGKSSVLEGLTDLPFPRDNGLCTRFATQICLPSSREVDNHDLHHPIICSRFESKRETSGFRDRPYNFTGRCKQSGTIPNASPVQVQLVNPESDCRPVFPPGLT